MRSVRRRGQNVLPTSRRYHEIPSRAPTGQEKYIDLSFPLFDCKSHDSIVLEIGCYTGYSALAWYESTVSTKAEIITLELDSKMIAASRRVFDKYGLNDRIKLIEGPAQASIEKLTGTFDIIFVDANKDGYEDYVKVILDKKLLAPNGFIMCDNSQLLSPRALRCNLT
jgi:predicted O-methyltransferase YrrM